MEAEKPESTKRRRIAVTGDTQEKDRPTGLEPRTSEGISQCEMQDLHLVRGVLLKHL